MTMHETSTRLLADLAERTMVTLRNEDGEPAGVTSGPNDKYREILEHLETLGVVRTERRDREVFAWWVEVVK
jgi:hypothetical protein